MNTYGNLAYKEEPKTEIIGGKLVMMASPVVNHIFIGANLSRIFGNYLFGKACTPFPDGTRCIWKKGKSTSRT